MFEGLTRHAFRAVGKYYPFQRTIRVFHNPLSKWATRPLQGAMQVKTRNGLKVLAIPSEHIGRQLYCTGTWDPHVLSLLTALSANAKVIVDVGANVGFFALSMAKASGGMVHAIEPQPRLADMMEQAKTASKVSNVIVHRVALSDQDADGDLAIDRANLGASRLNGGSDDSIRVSLRNGADFFAEVGVDEIDLMKVDVEGHEAQVFRGIEPLLAKHKVKVIVFETAHGNEETASLLTKHGYRFLAIRKGMRSPILHRQMDDPRSEDKLAIRPESYDEIALSLKRWMR